MTDRIRILVSNRETVVRLLSEALTRDYPPGARIKWHDHGLIRGGAVLMNTSGDRIKVRNDATGGERFIRASQIVS